eukprot:sb/3475429/
MITDSPPKIPLHTVVGSNLRSRKKFSRIVVVPEMLYYLGHVTGYQPIRDQYFLILSLPAKLTLISYPPKIPLHTVVGSNLRSKKKFSRIVVVPEMLYYLGHVTGYQPIRDQYFLILSLPAKLTLIS